MFIGLFVNVLIIIGIVFLIITAVNRIRRSPKDIDPGLGTVRRLYFYIISLVTLLVAANGVVLLAAIGLDSLFGNAIVSPSNTVVATGIALTLVGIPLWLFHWRLIQKYVRDMPVETHSLVRKTYIYLVLGVSFGITTGSAVVVLRWLFGGEEFSGWPWAAVVMFPLIWAYHWRLESSEGQPTAEVFAIRRTYIYIASGAMLAVAAIGFGRVIEIIFREAYWTLTDSTTLGRGGQGLWGNSMRDSMALAIVGCAGWAAHWLYLARGDYSAALRQVYLYTYAIFGSIVTILVVFGITLNNTFVWAFGVPAETGAADHFSFIAITLASFLTALVILAYHIFTAKKEEMRDQEYRSIRDSYPYAIAALGLISLGIAIGVIVVTGVDALAGGEDTVIVDQSLWRNGIAMALTLLIIGLPVWGWAWSLAQKRARELGVGERDRTDRRIFIFGVLGIAMLALVGGLSFFVFVFIRNWLDGDLSSFFSDARISLGAIVPALIFLPYYWFVYQEDKRSLATVERTAISTRKRKSVRVLVSHGDAIFLGDLEKTLGYGVIPLSWTDPEAVHPQLNQEQLAQLAVQIADAPGSNVLLIPEESGMRVLSYD